jgi:hypothetical protein
MGKKSWTAQRSNVMPSETHRDQILDGGVPSEFPAKASAANNAAAAFRTPCVIPSPL